MVARESTGIAGLTPLVLPLVDAPSCEYIVALPSSGELAVLLCVALMPLVFCRRPLPPLLGESVPRLFFSATPSSITIITAVVVVVASPLANRRSSPSASNNC
jgi:hypothetical protein